MQGNFIGTDVTGNTALPNYSGINLFGSASNNTIGGTVPGARNLISGNNRVSDADGIFIQHGSYNVIEGNYIGTNAAGTSSVPNASDGIWLGGPNNIVGGTQAGAGNLISGNGTPSNGADGIGIGSGRNAIQGNRIGTDASGSGPLPNTFGGVILWSGSISNTIGGTAAGAANIIAFNTGGPAIGITGTASVSNTILPNSIYANTSILGGQGGIDLGLDGVTPNQNCGGRSGPNHLLNYPVVTSAASNGSSTTISGSLNSTPSSTFTIEFFYNNSCDASGYGQGRYYLGSRMVTTNNSCITNFTVTFPIAVPSGDFVTSDATDGSGDTSESPSVCSQPAGILQLPHNIQRAPRYQERQPPLPCQEPQRAPPRLKRATSGSQTCRSARLSTLIYTAWRAWVSSVAIQTAPSGPTPASRGVSYPRLSQTPQASPILPVTRRSRTCRLARPSSFTSSA